MNCLPLYRDVYFIVNETHGYRLTSWKDTLMVYNGQSSLFTIFTVDQLWKLVPTGHKDGYYYIYNYWTWGRLTKYGPERHHVGLSRGPKYKNELWKLVPKKKTF